MDDMIIQNLKINMPAVGRGHRHKYYKEKRTPRRLKKRLKKKFGEWWRLPVALEPMLRYKDKRLLLTFLTKKDGK